ncbi:MAG: DEAD/DEAH box helicase, partial [Spirochaetaceae bacterium]|nr:DEAD/DEAH box helicase [Spirochaetaceae bacterium]
MEFDDLSLHPDVQRGISDSGFSTCMPVQEMVFAHSLSGQDIYAQSQTGTGKTAAFLVSIFQRIMTQSELRTRKALILAPTRELAVQIEAETKKLGKYLPISSGAFYGGVSYGPQVDMLRADVQIIIGTPGRIIDLLQQGKMILKEVGFLVVDEADRMFDMGFIDDLRRLLRYLPPPENRQTYLFSATLGLKVKELAWEYMRNPKEIVIEPERMTVELVTQELYHVGNHEKFPLLLGLLDREKPKSAIIFCNQKYMVEEIARRLQVNGIESEYIMGDLPQSKRLAIIERLKGGRLEILVATDVAARGLDVEALDLVVNYDVPEDPESYVHRIGRTARAGKAGKAVTLACERFVYGLPAIEDFINARIPVLRFDENLLLEDKSANIRFRREYDRSRGSHEGRDRRDGGRRADGRREMERGSRRREERPRNAPPRREPQREEQRPSQDRPRADQARPAPAQGAAGNPYALPQDQRIKMYKEKYGPQ